MELQGDCREGRHCGNGGQAALQPRHGAIAGVVEGSGEVIPAELRARVEADHMAVRPLPAPFLRAAWLLPFALLALVAAPAFFSVRADAAQLGWTMTWGVSALQVVLGLSVLVAALRESIPGRAWSLAAVKIGRASCRERVSFSVFARLF